MTAEDHVLMERNIMQKFVLSDELRSLLASAKEVIIPESRDDLLVLALGGRDNTTFDVCFEVEGRGLVREASVVRCKNGASVNYDEDYMRRRDPNSMVIGDQLPTDKTTYEERFGVSFDQTRQQTLAWLQARESLIMMPFMSGSTEMGLGYPSLLICPTNAAFLALALADLQGYLPKDEVYDNFVPRITVFVAPPFRHTHYDGKQVVVHNRSEVMHEIFAYNLYPGPSAKKGIYAALLDIGEREGWITLHASTVRAVTPYELTTTIMHEGASGGGKSEMIEAYQREKDGRLKLATNTITGEETFLRIADSLNLYPVTDDMAIAHPSLKYRNGNKLVVADAESGWFVRVDHIKQYGSMPDIEKHAIHPKKPIVFLNMEAAPNSTCLLWEHTKDSNGKPCPNPRLIMPRSFHENAINGGVEVDIRSFGIRTPPSTAGNPNYGIIGIFHVLPAALAWLWRLVAPRGFANPSISDGTKSGESKMHSEGVGSYWPFSTGRKVDQANLLLRQIIETPSTRYILIPNQHIGACRVGFAAQWATREYIARRGGIKFRHESLSEARCPLLGYALEGMQLDGVQISRRFLKVHMQNEVGIEGYDKGAKILTDFFKQELSQYVTPDLDPIGKKIIEACLADASVTEYTNFLANGMSGIFSN